MSFLKKVFGTTDKKVLHQEAPVPELVVNPAIPVAEPAAATAPVENPPPITMNAPLPVTPQNLAQQFQAWYDGLSEQDKKKVDNKASKYRLKYGSAVLCSKCNKPGGKFKDKGYTLKKLDDGSYIHMSGCPEDK